MHFWRQASSGARTAIRAENAGSLQAWLGAENWSALRPTGKRVAPHLAGFSFRSTLT